MVYLKFGAEATLRAKQARLVTPYDNKKNILTKGATLLTLPKNKTIWKQITTTKSVKTEYNNVRVDFV